MELKTYTGRLNIYKTTQNEITKNCEGVAKLCR
jgi:hypothetical protein